MASAKQRAWRKKFAKMAKSGKFRKRKTTTRRRRTTRKGMLTLKRKRAYSGKRKSNKPRRRSKSMSWSSKLRSGTAKKVLIGLGAAQLAGLAAAIFMPQFEPIVKPVAALIGGGVPGVAAELVLDQGVLGSITGMFGGGAPNVQNGAAGL